MSKVLNVLYGFKSETIEKGITREITLRGYEVNSTLRSTKDLIREYIKSHPELDVAILKEYLDGGGKYTSRELSELTDDCDVRIVIVIGTEHRGKPEMRDYYASGILTALFSDGKFGANPDKLADLAVKGRTRRQAREYYHIEDVVPDHINLTYEQYRDNLKYLVDKRYGANVVDRFVTISNGLYPGQMGAFIDDLPDSVRDVLMQYGEFYDIAKKIYGLGYMRRKYKRPKIVKYALTKDAMLEKYAEDDEGVQEAPVVLTSVQSYKEADEPQKPEEVDAPEPEPESLESREENTKKAKKEKKGLFGRKKKDKESIFDEERNEELDDGPEEEDGLSTMRKEMAHGTNMAPPEDFVDLADEEIVYGEENNEEAAGDDEGSAYTDASYDDYETYEEAPQEEDYEEIAGDDIEETADIDSDAYISDEAGDMPEESEDSYEEAGNEIPEEKIAFEDVAEEPAQAEDAEEEIDYSKYSVEELMNMLGQ